MKSEALVSAIESGNLHRCVSESGYEENLAATYKALKKFNKVSPSDVKFDPSIHLKYYSNDPVEQHKFHNTRRLTMDELGLASKNQISPIGVSDPFPLFTDEAIALMKQEILEKDLFMKYARFSQSSTSGVDCSIRGYAKNGDEIAAPFTFQAWTHPKTMELISTMAGVDLEIVMDYEIAHVNIAMQDPAVAQQELIKKSRESALKGGSDGRDIPAIVGWHHDSYPFVCVLMLSDTTNMIGGETSLRMGDNSKVAVVPSPQSGSANVLQGRLIQHIAPNPVGISERITMVTSYRAKDPLVKEGSILNTVKPEYSYGSRYNDFYPQWIDYRVKILKERLDHLNKTCSDETGKFNKEHTTAYLKEIEDYLRITYKEMEVSAKEYERAAKNTPFAK